ncbi:MAG: hypothetical protein ACOYLB_09285 [Phototrophicaceae bacterium]
MLFRNALVCVVVVLGVGIRTATAQYAGVWQVFVTHDPTTTLDTLSFVAMQDGNTTTLEVYGERYTPYGEQVLFFDRFNGQVMLAHPNGELTPHPFIQPNPQTAYVDWVADDATRQIAWTFTQRAPSGELSTLTTLAQFDGTNPRILLEDVPRRGVRAIPLAFIRNQSALLMDYQPDQIGALTPYDEFAGMFQMPFDAPNQPLFLPNEPGCYCGGDLHGALFVRLSLSDDLSGFEVHIHNLLTQASTTLPSVRLSGFTQAGDVMISPDERVALYALAQVEKFGSAEQTVRTAYVLVDLVGNTQSILMQPSAVIFRPIQWTQNNASMLFYDPNQNGTWELRLDLPRFEKIANARYIGIITSDANKIE